MKRLKEAWSAFWKALAGVGVLVGLLTGIPMLLDMYGTHLTGIWTIAAANAFWALPLGCFSLGFVAAWNLHENIMRGKEADRARHKALRRSAEAYYERLESLRSVIREATALEAVSIADGAPNPDGPTGDVFTMAAMFGRNNAMGFAFAFDQFAGDRTGYARWRGMALVSNIRNYLKDVAEEIDFREISDYQFASATLPAARSFRRKLEKLDALVVSEINAPRFKPHREHGPGRRLWFKWYQWRFRHLRNRTARMLDRAGLSPCPDLVPGIET